MSSDAKLETLMRLNFAIMRLYVHERNFEAALRQSNKISEGFHTISNYRDFHAHEQDILAFQSEVSDIERLSEMPVAIDDYKKAIADWERFIKASRANDQYEWREYLARSRYGLGLAEAQQKDFESAVRDLEIADQFFQKNGKDQALADRVRKAYQSVLRKTSPFTYLFKSLRS